jgi:DGQHR domain-containing protein
MPVNGRDVTVFMAFMSHEDLKRLTDIHQFAIEDATLGYQRKLDTKNLKGITAALSKGTPAYGAIYLNARPFEGISLVKWFSVSDDPDDPRSTVGQIAVPDQKFLYIVDGQHRVGSFEAVARKHLTFPVVIYDGLTVKEENECFMSLNFYPKKVPQSLAHAIDLQLADQVTNIGQLSTAIVMRLVRDKKSPWYRRIVTDGQARNRMDAALTTSSGFASSIRTHLLRRDHPFSQLDLAKQVEILKAYWTAIFRLWPECATEKTAYRLFSGMGPAIMHALLYDHVNKQIIVQDASAAEFEKTLEPMRTMGRTILWHAKEGPFKGMRGTGGFQIAGVPALERPYQALMRAISEQDIELVYQAAGVPMPVRPDQAGD